MSSSRCTVDDGLGSESTFKIKKKFALQKKLKVLLVEDNSFSISNFMEYLRTLEVSYQVADSAEESVNIFKSTLEDG